MHLRILLLAEYLILTGGLSLQSFIHLYLRSGSFPLSCNLHPNLYPALLILLLKLLLRLVGGHSSFIT